MLFKNQAWCSTFKKTIPEISQKLCQQIVIKQSIEYFKLTYILEHFIRSLPANIIGYTNYQQW